MMYFHNILIGIFKIKSIIPGFIDLAGNLYFSNLSYVIHPISVFTYYLMGGCFITHNIAVIHNGLHSPRNEIFRIIN